jgi:hypothetical protein
MTISILSRSVSPCRWGGWFQPISSSSSSSVRTGSRSGRPVVTSTITSQRLYTNTYTTRFRSTIQQYDFNYYPPYPSQRARSSISVGSSDSTFTMRPTLPIVTSHVRRQQRQQWTSQQYFSSNMNRSFCRHYIMNNNNNNNSNSVMMSKYQNALHPMVPTVLGLVPNHNHSVVRRLSTSSSSVSFHFASTDYADMIYAQSNHHLSSSNTTDKNQQPNTVLRQQALHYLQDTFDPKLWHNDPVR